VQHTRLRILGIEDITFGTILTPIIYNKLPSEVRKNITRERGNDNWDLNALRSSIKKELCVQNAGQPINNADFDPEVIPTASFITSTYNRERKQLQNSIKQYCGEQHHPNSCKTVPDKERRLEIVKRNDVCFNCFPAFGKHKIKEYKSQNSCRKCHRRHHTSICNAEEKVKQPTTYRNNTDSTPSVNYVNSEDAPKQPISEVNFHSGSSKSPSNVLLKTAVAPVSSRNVCCDSNILLDKGAQRSFISKDLAERLNLEPTRTENISISGFGETSSRTRQLD
jgi:hypothetical protein